MKIGYNQNPEWHKDHPMGTLVFQYLLTGESGSPDNFVLVLARQEADFTMQRHRHNFEQIRLPLHGDMNIGDGIILKQGQVGYFPEGLPYGPQDDPLGKSRPGERLQLVLQFGGSSGCGFMSMEQRKAAWGELEKTGHFKGPVYHRPDGRKQWGLNAVWEQVFGERLKYPLPRYDHVVVADPARFNWLPVAGAPGVERKFMGAFSERAVRVEMWRVAAGTRWSSTDNAARRLFYVQQGPATINGETAVTGAAIDILAGEAAHVEAAGPLELFMIALPPVVVPERPAGEQFEVVDGLVDSEPARQ